MGNIKMAVPVPESVLKKRKTQEKLANEKAVATGETKKANKAKRAAAYKSAEKYVKEYRSLARARVRMHRQAKAAGNHYVEPEAKLMFVVRIRGLNDMHPKTKKILQIMRLRQINLGVFMKVSKAATEMLKRVEPYLAYGYPNLKSVSSSTSAGSGRLTSSVCHSTTTRSWRLASASTASSAWRTLSTRSSPLGHTSHRPTTSCGRSSSVPRRGGSPRSARDSVRAARPATARIR